MIDTILKAVMARFGIEEKDIDKIKFLLNKVEFTKVDGKNMMLIKIGEGVELKIEQPEDK